jgi:hypothetical protein
MTKKDMKTYRRNLFTSILILAFLAGCGGQPADPAAAVSQDNAQPIEETQPEELNEPTEPVADAADTEAATEVASEQPAAAVTYTLSDQPYVSPSNAFSIYLPENWNCSETGDYRVDCYNTDNSASLLVRAIGTGYELLQDDFISLTQAEMVSTYEDLRAYTEVSQEVLEGTVINESTWRVGETYWQGIDRFVRSGPSVYYLKVASVQEDFESYRGMFNELIQKVELNDAVMSYADLYVSRKEYVTRELIFTIDVPTSWTKFVDAATIQNTVVSGFLSPDKQASVQVAIYSKGSHISQDFKGTKTLEIMRDLYGWDMRINVDKVQPDGREMLEWYGERKGIRGITYFDSLNTSIFFLSVVWEDSSKDVYLPVLQEILDSFEYYQ